MTSGTETRTDVVHTTGFGTGPVAGMGSGSGFGTEIRTGMESGIGLETGTGTGMEYVTGLETGTGTGMESGIDEKTDVNLGMVMISSVKPSSRMIRSPPMHGSGASPRISCYL